MSSHPALRSSARMRPAISYSTLFIEAPQKRSLVAATKLLFRSHQAIHFSEKLAPDTYYLVRVALRLMGVAASALDTGQFSLASCASFWKVSSSMPGTTASVSRSIGLMAKPPGTWLKWTRAVVCTLVGVKPALASAFDSAIEKQPACAAPISSSGLVP